MELGLRMDSEYSLPMGMIYTSPVVMARNPKNFCPSRVFLIGYAGHLTVYVYAFQCSTKRPPNQIRCGKFRPTAPIFILCFPVGTILPRNVAVVGHRIGRTSSSRTLATVRHTSVQSPATAALYRKPSQQ